MSMLQNLQNFIFCVKCFSDTCDHWKLTGIKTIGTVSDTTSTKYGNVRSSPTIETCLLCKCGKQHSIKPVDSNCIRMCTCSCNNAVIYGHITITPTMAISLVKYPRDKCPDCKGSGNRTIYSFARCLNCEGTGGIICTECRGFGKVLSPYAYTIKCSYCTSGYKRRCIVCNGSGATVSVQKSIPCTKCEIWTL